MESKYTNGKTVIITESFEESITEINNFVSKISPNAKPISNGYAKDFEIKGGETLAYLKQIANDYYDIIYEANCDAKEDWRYNF